MPMNLFCLDTNYIHISDVKIFSSEQETLLILPISCQSFSSTSQQRRSMNLKHTEVLNSLNSLKENNISNTEWQSGFVTERGF